MEHTYEAVIPQKQEPMTKVCFHSNSIPNITFLLSGMGVVIRIWLSAYDYPSVVSLAKKFTFKYLFKNTNQWNKFVSGPS